MTTIAPRVSSRQAPLILDTTLRDGSYVVDFRFTARDHAVISARLDAAGVPLIEVAHGLGLGAGRRSDMRSADNDEAYLEATASSVRRGRWGAFFIPGIGTLEDIDRAATYGMHFLRVGTNVTEVEQSEPYIRRAKEHGMFVAANYMKTYAVSPDSVGELAMRSHAFGADIVCVVDSAGGMLPSDVEAYFSAIRERSDIAIGFHGHNNLGLAAANTLRAVEMGAAIVDTSMRGLGRSAGNAVTEITLLALKRLGLDCGIDVRMILDTAERYIDPILRNYSQVTSIGIISGYAQFHSSFFGAVMRHARAHNVDPRELIVRLTARDKVNAPDELLEAICLELLSEASKRASVQLDAPLSLASLPEGEVSWRATIMAERARTVAKKLGGVAVFNLVQGVRTGGMTTVSSTINEGDRAAVVSAEVYGAHDAGVIAAAIDGMVDYVLLDADVKAPWSEEALVAVAKGLRTTPSLPYSDLDAWARATVLLADRLLGGLRGARLTVLGHGALSEEVARRCERMGGRLVPTSDGDLSLAIVGGPLDGDGVASIASVSTILDAWVGGTVPSHGGATVVRVTMHDVILSEVMAGVLSHRGVSSNLGMRKLNGIDVAAGGYQAPAGTVIVDSLSQPSRVLGIADGVGRLRGTTDLSQDDAERCRQVEVAILNATPALDQYGA